MPRKKIVTVESINEVIEKMKRLKKSQVTKVKIGERADGQPIYHYPSITIPKLAKALGVHAMTIYKLKDTDIKIKDCLLRVGQRKQEQDEYKPSVNSKAWIEQNYKKLKIKYANLEEEVKTLNRVISEQAETIEQFEENEKNLAESTRLINQKNSDLFQKDNEIRMLKIKIKNLENIIAKSK